eukprot:scaffold26314_cov63-Phaeocystis_antarctica.AAC.4
MTSQDATVDERGLIFEALPQYGASLWCVGGLGIGQASVRSGYAQLFELQHTHAVRSQQGRAGHRVRPKSGEHPEGATAIASTAVDDR